MTRVPDYGDVTDFVTGLFAWLQSQNPDPAVALAGMGIACGIMVSQTSDDSADALDGANRLCELLTRVAMRE